MERRFRTWLGLDQSTPEPEAVIAAAFPLQGGDRESYVDQYDLTHTLSTMLNSESGGNNSLAWHYYRRNPELHFLVSLLSNNLGKVRLYAARAKDGAGEPEELDENHPAQQLLSSFAGV